MGEKTNMSKEGHGCGIGMEYLENRKGRKPGEPVRSC